MYLCGLQKKWEGLKYLRATHAKPKIAGIFKKCVNIVKHSRNQTGDFNVPRWYIKPLVYVSFTGFPVFPVTVFRSGVVLSREENDRNSLRLGSAVGEK